MDSYTGFAEVYDLFMDNVPYEKWCDYLTCLLKEQGISSGILLDLGCGTGKLTRLLSARGYDMIGVDISEEMLGIAMEENHENILYLCQDMREFELYGTVAAAVSICDSMNYIITPEDLTRVFRLVNNYLDPGGVFIFDLNTIVKYEALGEATIAETREESSFIWENCYDKSSRINEYNLTLYIAGGDGRFDRYFETHYQRAYTLDEIKTCLKDGGLTFVAAYDAFTKEAPRADSERIYVIAKEHTKKTGE